VCTGAKIEENVARAVEVLAHEVVEYIIALGKGEDFGEDILF
jgi:TATA-box binding protein (TBP) (component of TFIID and TFIIIB)